MLKLFPLGYSKSHVPNLFLLQNLKIKEIKWWFLLLVESNTTDPSLSWHYNEELINWEAKEKETKKQNIKTPEPQLNHF